MARLGGKAKAAKMTKQERLEHARKMVSAREAKRQVKRDTACSHDEIRYCRVPGCAKHDAWYCDACDAPVSEQVAIAKGATTNHI